MRHIERRVLLSEISNVVSAQLRPDVSAGILKLMKIRLCGFTFLAVVDPCYTERTKYSILNSVKYLDVIFDKKVIRTLHIEMLDANAFRTLIRIYSLFESEQLNTNTNLILHKHSLGVS
jgi:hypothetical protein